METLIALLPKPIEGTLAENHTSIARIAADIMLDALLEEPKIAPESQISEIETPTGRSINQATSLRPARNTDADPAEGNEGIDISGGWPSDAAIFPRPPGARPRAS